MTYIINNLREETNHAASARGACFLTGYGPTTLGFGVVRRMVH
jgi:hypothetical protein